MAGPASLPQNTPVARSAFGIPRLSSYARAADQVNVGGRARPPVRRLRLVAVVAIDIAAVVGTLLATAGTDRLVAAVIAFACSLAIAAVAIRSRAASSTLADQLQELRTQLDLSEELRRQSEQSHRLERRRSSTDQLTGVLSRRALMSSIQKEANRAVRHGRPLALLFFDVDHFKEINDQHGHPVGDQVLVELATRVRSGIRSYDQVGRWGGDEFCVLVPEHRVLESTSVVAEHLREAVSARPIETRRGPISVTISVGAVLIDPATPSPEEMCALADAALYRAKRAGRNRVVAERIEVSIRSHVA